MNKIFTYEFEDLGEDGSLSIESEPTPPAVIKLEIDDEQGFWLQANRPGWMHLAKICVELGLGSFEDGYHFHVNETFSWSSRPPEFTLTINDKLMIEHS